ncbi:MAG TPA: O-methyltransferase [Thermoplasmata archaeon]|nr:O-methyltransferase [Thermoplasmata archaeon]
MAGSDNGIVLDDVRAYLDGLANPGGTDLAALEAEGLRDGWPIVGRVEGSLLHILASAIGARRILELGTAIGYSGTWLARALPPDGTLVTVEGNPDTAKIAAKNFERLGVADRVTLLVGRADDVLEDLTGPFDLIFNDIDKDGYPAVLEPSVERLRVGGLLVTDNVLWQGDVARKSRSAETKAIRAYNERLANDPRMIAVITPVRDGVSIALKLRA